MKRNYWPFWITVLAIFIVGIAVFRLLPGPKHSKSSATSYSSSDVEQIQRSMRAYVPSNPYIPANTYCYGIFSIEPNVAGRSTECFNRYMRPGRFEHHLDSITKEAYAVVYAGCFSKNHAGEGHCTRVKNRWLRRHGYQ